MMEISVCVGSACHIKGAYNSIQVFQQMIEEHSLHDRVNLKAAFCNRLCQKKGVSVSVDSIEYNIAPEDSRKFFEYIVMPQVDACKSGSLVTEE